MKALSRKLQKDPLIEATINDPNLAELRRDPAVTAIRNHIQGMFLDPPSNRKIFFSEKTRQYLVTRSSDQTVLALVDADIARYVIADNLSYRRVLVPSKNVSREPPRAAKLLLLFIPKKNREHLLGDLEEEYQTSVLPEYGLRAARRWYWWHVCLSIGPFAWVGFKRVAGFVLLWKSVR
jgi:hypothetical protein